MPVTLSEADPACRWASNRKSPVRSLGTTRERDGRGTNLAAIPTVGRVSGLRVGVAAFNESRRMNEIETAQFAVGGSLVAACFILGLVITELLRKLAKEREEVQRLRRLNSKNYHHRKTMERAVAAYWDSLDYDIKLTQAAHAAMVKACNDSKEDND